MKKLTSTLLLLSLLISLVACGAKPEATTQVTAAPTKAPATEQTTDPAPEPTTIYHNTQWDGKTLKVLCVGNSFARNATNYLYDIAAAEGVEEIILGVLHIGGCTVEKHWSKAQSGEAAYKYYKNTDGSWKLTENATLLYGLQDEQWDVITITQGSGYYGIPNSYNECLPGLIGYINENKLNPDAQLAFHMTWAFPPDCTNSRFVNYGNDQLVMFQCVTDTAKGLLEQYPELSFILPSGTAIQNVRTVLGEVLFDEDKFHLNKTGQFVAGYMWYASLTGQPITELKYIAPVAVPVSSWYQPIVDAVNAGLKAPLSYTDIS